MRELSEEDNRLISAFLENMVKLMKKETDKCVRCGTQIQAMQKIGRCVYARPCGCRLWQGKVPDAWLRKE